MTTHQDHDHAILTTLAVCLALFWVVVLTVVYGWQS